MKKVDEPKEAEVIDLIEALKRSLGQGGGERRKTNSRSTSARKAPAGDTKKATAKKPAAKKTAARKRA